MINCSCKTSFNSFKGLNIQHVKSVVAAFKVVVSSGIVCYRSSSTYRLDRVGC